MDHYTCIDTPGTKSSEQIDKHSAVQLCHSFDNMLPVIVSFILLVRLTIADIVFPENLHHSLPPASHDLSSCVPLEQCGPLHVMWESRYIMMNTMEALGALQSAHCGFSPSTHDPVFRCPGQSENGVSRHVISDGGFRTQDCSGSIKLFARHEAEPELVTTESMNKVNVAVGRVIVEGNCCWRLHRNKRFRGRSMTIRAGVTNPGIGTVKSIRKLEHCPFV